MKIQNYIDCKLNNTAVALGKFEGLHKGHMLLIHEITRVAKGSELESVVFTIHMPKASAIFTREERMELLRESGIDYAIECDFTKEFGAMSPEAFVKDILIDKLGAKYVVVGTDFCFGHNREGNVKLLRSFGEKYGFSVIAFEKLCENDKVISSSLIRELIRSGSIVEANRLMGRDYYLDGRVTAGRKLGRTIGFPTINFYPNTDKLLPLFGVYETELMIDGKLYRGITNVGNNPTICDDNPTCIETHILNYSGDLYEQDIRIVFKNFVREQKKFNSINELKNQINNDILRVSLHQ